MKGTEYIFMGAPKVIDLDWLIVGLQDYIFGDLNLSEQETEVLSEKFQAIQNIIDSCKREVE